MAVSILSYRGSASLTVIGDARLVPDPQAITDEFNREFKKMLKGVIAVTATKSAKKAPARKVAAKKALARKAPARKAPARKAPAPRRQAA
jgi:hypothetical protein